MKEPAQAAYETFSTSFGLGDKLRQFVHIPVTSWENLPDGEKARWRLTIEAGINQQQANALANATQIANGWKNEKKLAETVKASPPEPTKPKVIDTTGEKVKDA